ncbi:MAG: PCP reductase family protein [Sandaracinaceae bacterium]|nr:PCP reductase family protein [Sandaracinaceae bacterium]
MSELRWSPEAEARLAKVPFFVRFFVKRRAEAAAKERGLTEVTSALLDEIKSSEHRG